MRVAALVILGAATAPAQEASAGLSLDSLLNTRISAASKYDQAVTAAPASVTIVTSDDIRRYGYRNLQEVLENVRGFYVSNDRNYPFLGTRGFGRPADYNNRILVLVDGQSMNEVVWGATPIGSDLPIALEAVERIEVVRGPGSALYGTSAMFAVINIVTKSGTAIDGVQLRAGAGSFGERVASVVGGRALGARGGVSGSALVSRITGEDQYYTEFDAPATANGIAHSLDWERAVSLLGSLQWDGISVHAGYRKRDKGIPTAIYGSAFGDTREMTTDDGIWGDLTLGHEWSGALSGRAKVYVNRVRYRGVYPFEGDIIPYTDAGVSLAVGTEQVLTWEPSSRDRLTLGTEITRALRAEYSEIVNGTVAKDDKPHTFLSAFAQNEWAVRPSATLVTGLRVDHGAVLMPRIALLLTPDKGTTVKLMYGEAFRAPSPAEALFNIGTYTANPAIRPERVRTTELEVQRRVASSMMLGLSLYRYHITDLIDQVPVTPLVTRFENVSSAIGEGIEAELDVRPAGPLGMHASYAFQRSEGESGAVLTNSPRHVSTVSVTARSQTGLRSAALLRHESARRTITGGPTSPFTRVDTHVGFAPSALAGPRFDGLELSLRVTNLLNAAYATPAGTGNVQPAIAADGRSLALRLDWRL